MNGNYNYAQRERLSQQGDGGMIKDAQGAPGNMMTTTMTAARKRELLRHMGIEDGPRLPDKIQAAIDGVADQARQLKRPPTAEEHARCCDVMKAMCTSKVLGENVVNHDLHRRAIESFEKATGYRKA